MKKWLARRREAKYRRWFEEGRRCTATSGVFVGYRCDLRFGHPDAHGAITSMSTSNGREVGRTTVNWPNYGWIGTGKVTEEVES